MFKKDKNMVELRVSEDGSSFWVDASEEACKPFGVKPGEKIIFPALENFDFFAAMLGAKIRLKGEEFVVAGVAPCNAPEDSSLGHDVVWFKNKEGYARRFSEDPMKTKVMELGARRPGEVEAKQKELAENGGAKVKVAEGVEIYVDPSDEACEPFGFKSGTILEFGRERFLVRGVAPVIVEVKNGEVVFHGGCDGLFLSVISGDGAKEMAYPFSRVSYEQDLVKMGLRLAGEIEAKQKELIENGGVKVTARDGKIFYLDPSDEACEPFGFKSGEKVLDPMGREVEMIGVGPSGIDRGFDRMWYRMGGEERVSAWSGVYDEEHNLKGHGFRPVAESAS
ncbi:hypothetical protein B6U91_01405 [Candidatus Pacearchaeota archaeon ex4484_71]|nr:MAG: hypothetical protein B6U91_01405 [Candidatus Pacearchaeota archaeon ex4484_71]